MLTDEERLAIKVHAYLEDQMRLHKKLEDILDDMRIIQAKKGVT